MYEESDEQVPKQGIAQKSTYEGFQTQSEEYDNDERETTSINAKGFKKKFQKHRGL